MAGLGKEEHLQSNEKAQDNCPHLTRMQAKKVKDLVDKGGKAISVTIQVAMPDGTVASINSFSRVEWKAA